MTAMIDSLTTSLQKEYGAELNDELVVLENKMQNLRHLATKKYPKLPRYSDELIHGTINAHDAKILYLLIRRLKPKTIFEIGTWIGTSALVMAEAVRINNNGGKIYTCDINHYYLLDTSYDAAITCINEYSDVAVAELPTGTKVDFIFTDGELSFPTVKALKKKMSADAVIVTHDFVTPAEKGVLNVVRAQMLSRFKYNLVRNKNAGATYENSSIIAALFTNATTKKLGIARKYWIQKVAEGIFLATRALIAKVYKN